MNDIVKRMMHDVPRGDTTRPLREQKVPQARWMEVDAILRSPGLVYDPREPGSKLLVGAIGDKLIGIDDPRHCMQVAGSRSGKSVHVESNLFFYPGSVLAMDPKGELANLTARRRAALGQRVVILDPFGICSLEVAQYRASYNPMDMLFLESPTLLEDAGLLVDSLIVQPMDPRDPHWDESGRHFGEGVTLFVATAPQFEGKRDLTVVRKLISKALWVPKDAEDDDAPPTLYSDMMAHADSLSRNSDTADVGEAIAASATEFYGKKGTELSGVHSTITRHTKFLDYPSFRRILTKSDFRLADLKKAPKGLTVYLCFPATRINISKRWLRIFVNQLIAAAEVEKTKPKAPVLVCLDEFPVLGYMNQLEMACGLVAGLDLKMWLMLQDWQQGVSLYKERWETFAGNAGIIQVFGNNDVATTEYFSKYLGKTQVEVARLGEVAQDQQNKGLSGRSQEIVLYDLMTPDEIRRYFSRSDRLKRQLVSWAGHHPMLLQRVEWYDKSGPLYKYLRET